MEKKSFSEMVLANREAIAEALRGALEPVFDERHPEKYEATFRRYAALNRELIPMQAVKAAAIEAFLEGERACIASLDTGFGKTTVATAIASHSDLKNVVVVAPPHLTEKWEREIREILGEGNYEIVQVRSWSSLLPLTKKGTPVPRKTFYIVPKTIGSLGYKLERYFVRRQGTVTVKKTIKMPGGYKERREVEVPALHLCCPDCFKPFRSYRLDEGRRAPGSFQKIPSLCPECGAPMLRPARDKKGRIPRKVSPAEFLGRYAKKGAIDLLIVDEIHEEKAKDTARAEAFGKLVAKSKKAVGLTGTLLGGYASHAFYTLFRLFPKIFKEELGMGWGDLQKFVDRFGGVEYLWEAEEGSRAGSWVTGDRLFGKKERPDLSPKLLEALLPAVVFGRLDELKFRDADRALPPYEEHSHKVAVEEEIAEPYREYLGEIVEAARMANREGDEETARRLFSLSQREALLLPDTPHVPRSVDLPWIEEVGKKKIYHPLGRIVEYRPRIERDTLTAKERKLVTIVDKAIRRGRKVLVCHDFVEGGVRERLIEVLATSKAERVESLTVKVEASKREAYIKALDCDVVVTNPELVKTGLDLIEYPTIMFYEQAYSSYNVFTLRQAAKRAWRIGQTESCEVHSIAYAGTYQAKALELIGGKMNVSQGIEGRLSTGADIASEADDENMQIEMAKAIVARERIANATVSSKERLAFGERPWTEAESFFLGLLDEKETSCNVAEETETVVIPGTLRVERRVRIGNKVVVKTEEIERENLAVLVAKTGPVQATLF